MRDDRKVMMRSAAASQPGCGACTGDGVTVAGVSAGGSLGFGTEGICWGDLEESDSACWGDLEESDSACWGDLEESDSACLDSSSPFTVDAMRMLR